MVNSRGLQVAQLRTHQNKSPLSHLGRLLHAHSPLYTITQYMRPNSARTRSSTTASVT